MADYFERLFSKYEREREHLKRIDAAEAKVVKTAEAFESDGDSVALLEAVHELYDAREAA